MKRFPYLVQSLLILLLTVLALSPAVMAEQPVIATVNGHEITEAEFYAELEAMAGEYVLNQLILEVLLEQRRVALDVEVSEAAMAEFMAMIMGQLGGEMGLQQFLMQNQMTMEQLEQEIYWNVLITTLAEAEVDVSEEAVAQWFEENKGRFHQPEQVMASHILVDTEDEAVDLMGRIEAGEEFADLARAYSLDPGSAQQGGSLGFFARGMMVEPFEALAFSLAIDEMGITESDFGWHLILVTDKTEAKEATLEEDYDQILAQMVAMRSMDPNAYLNMLQMEADLVIFPERYQHLGQ